MSHEAAAAFRLAVTVKKRVALALELPRHLVEQTAQGGNLIIAVAFGNLHIQITAAHPLRRPRQTPSKMHTSLASLRASKALSSCGLRAKSATSNSMTVWVTGCSKTSRSAAQSLSAIQKNAHSPWNMPSSVCQ